MRALCSQARPICRILFRGGGSQKLDILLKPPPRAKFKNGGVWGRVLRGFFAVRGYRPREGHRHPSPPSPPPNNPAWRTQNGPGGLKGHHTCTPNETHSGSHIVSGTLEQLGMRPRGDATIRTALTNVYGRVSLAWVFAAMGTGNLGNVGSTFTGHVLLFVHGHCLRLHTGTCCADFLARNTLCARASTATLETARSRLTTHPRVRYHLSLLQVHSHMMAHPCQSNGHSAKQTKSCCICGLHTSMCHTNVRLCTQLGTIWHLCGFMKEDGVPIGMTKCPLATIWASKKTTCPFLKLTFRINPAFSRANPTISHPLPTLCHPVTTLSHPPPTLPRPLPTLSLPLPTLSYPLPTLSHPHPPSPNPLPPSPNPLPLSPNTLPPPPNPLPASRNPLQASPSALPSSSNPLPPSLSLPSPTLSRPSPTGCELSPTLSQPSPTVSQPSPTLNQPSPTLPNPSPTLSQPSPTLSQPSPTPSQPSPTLSQPSPNPLPPSSNPLATLSHPLPTLSHPLPTPSHPLLTLYHPLYTLFHHLPTFSHPLPTLSHPLPTLSNPLPTLSHPLPTLSHPLPTLSHPLPTLSNPHPTLSHPLLTLSDPL